MVNRPTEAPASTLLEQARAARSGLQWRTAAQLFSQAANALPAEPHGAISATEISLRRDAHLCLCRTDAFQKYRESERTKRRTDFSGEWLRPTGDLVKQLLPQRAQARG